MLSIILPIAIFIILRIAPPKVQSLGFPIFTFFINLSFGALNSIICLFLYLTFFNVDGEKLYGKKFKIEVIPQALTIYNENKFVEKIMNI